jgi:hypothetical protein
MRLLPEIATMWMLSDTEGLIWLALVAVAVALLS